MLARKAEIHTRINGQSGKYVANGSGISPASHLWARFRCLSRDDVDRLAAFNDQHDESQPLDNKRNRATTPATARPSLELSWRAVISQ